MDSFKKYDEYKEQLMFENSKGEKICIFPGRFMPAHNGHIAAMERTSKYFKCKVVPIQILVKGQKSPFPETILKKIGKDLVKEFSFIADFIIFPNNLTVVISEMVKLLISMGYNPVGVGSGSDRVKDYQRQTDYMLGPKSDFEISEFGVAMVDVRDANGPSATKVRGYLTDDDYESFVKSTPKSVQKYYNELKKYI